MATINNKHQQTRWGNETSKYAERPTLNAKGKAQQETRTNTGADEPTAMRNAQNRHRWRPKDEGKQNHRERGTAKAAT